MKLSLTALFIALISCVNAQKIPVPGRLASPDSGLAIQLKTMAPRAIPLVSEEDPADLYYNKALLYILAENFPAALAQLDSLAELRNHGGPDWFAVDAIDLRSYTLTRLGMTGGRTFDKVFPDTIAHLYNDAPKQSKPYAASFFPADSASQKERLIAEIAKLRSKDSLPVNEVIVLGLRFFATFISTRMSPVALLQFRKEDEKIYIIQDSVLIDAGAGVKLAAVIVRHRNITAPQPAIMRYNIYASQTDVPMAEAMADKGYVGIVLLTRGKYLSQNTIEPFEHDGEDVWHAIDWISKQPWSNGKVGMFGGSYLGFSQWSAAKRVHPALKTIVPQVAVGAGVDYPQYNGVFMSYMLRWIHYVSNNKFSDRAEFSNTGKWDSLFQNWYRSGRSFRSLDTMDGRLNTVFQRWLDHPMYDQFWQKMVPYKDEFARINIPVLTTTGYYDDDQRGAFYYMQQHLNRNKQANHYLLIGPWDHGGGQGFGRPTNGQYKVDSVAVFDVNTTVYQWFDHILKDSAMPARLKDRVNFEVSGANEWRSVSSLKAASNDSLVLYLGNTISKNAYKLVTQKPSRPGSILQEISYTDRSDATTVFDPDGLILDTVLKTPEQLVFISDSLKAPVVMSGSMQGMLNITINKKDVDVHVRLYELTNDGRYYLLSRYWGRASYVKDREHRTLLTPGKPEQVPINNAYYMCRKLAAGSRLVVTAGIVKTPNWELNYGSGKPVETETIADGAVPLEITWGNDSFVKVPVLR